MSSSSSSGDIPWGMRPGDYNSSDSFDPLDPSKTRGSSSSSSSSSSSFSLPGEESSFFPSRDEVAGQLDRAAEAAKSAGSYVADNAKTWGPRAAGAIFAGGMAYGLMRIIGLTALGSAALAGGKVVVVGLLGYGAWRLLNFMIKSPEGRNNAALALPFAGLSIPIIGICLATMGIIGPMGAAVMIVGGGLFVFASAINWTMRDDEYTTVIPRSDPPINRIQGSVSPDEDELDYPSSSSSSSSSSSFSHLRPADEVQRQRELDRSRSESEEDYSYLNFLKTSRVAGIAGSVWSGLTETFDGLFRNTRENYGDDY